VIYIHVFFSPEIELLIHNGLLWTSMYTAFSITR